MFLFNMFVVLVAICAHVCALKSDSSLGKPFLENQFQNNNQRDEYENNNSAVLVTMGIFTTQSYKIKKSQYYCFSLMYFIFSIF